MLPQLAQTSLHEAIACDCALKKSIGSTARTILSDTVERPCRSIFVFIYLGIRSLQVQILVAVYDFALQRVNTAPPISLFNLDRSGLIEWSDRSAFNLTQFLFRVVYIKLYRINKHGKAGCLWCIFFSIFISLTGFQHDNSWLFTKLLLLSSNAYSCKNPAPYHTALTVGTTKLTLPLPGDQVFCLTTSSEDYFELRGSLH